MFFILQIVNNKQIMYDCDKGYVLEIGPPGATCVGGKWRPLELPQCLLGQHPRLRFNRRKRRRRSVEMRHLRLSALMQEYRNIERKLRQYQYELENNPNYLDNANEQRKELLKAYKLTKPQKRFRNEDVIDKAYSRYYQYIKQKYQNYVKHLLGYQNQAISRPNNKNENILSKSLQTPNTHWYNSYPAHFIVEQGERKDFRSPKMQFKNNSPTTLQGPFMARIPLPNIHEKSYYNMYHFTNEPTLNDYDYLIDSIKTSYRPNDKIEDVVSPRSGLDKSILQLKQQPGSMNTTDYINQLKAQIIRRRRRRDISPTAISPTISPSMSLSNNSNHSVLIPAISEDSEDFTSSGRKKVRGPCEDLDWDSFANITTIRSGKVPGRSAVGIILLLECNAGFKLNLKDENTTARCIRGTWKPETPKCISGTI